MIIKKRRVAPAFAAERALARAAWGAGMFVPTAAWTLASVATRLDLGPAETAWGLGLLQTGAAAAACGSTPLVRGRSTATLIAGPVGACLGLIGLLYEPRLALLAAPLIGVAASLTLTAFGRQVGWRWDAPTQTPLRIRLWAGALTGALLPAIAAEAGSSVVGTLVVLALGSAALVVLAVVQLDELPAKAWHRASWVRRFALYGISLPLAAVLFLAGGTLRAELAAFPELTRWGLLGLVLVLAFPRPRANMAARGRPRITWGVLGCQLVAVALACVALSSEHTLRALLWGIVVALVALSIVPARGMLIDAAGSGMAGPTTWLVLVGCLGYTAGPLTVGTPGTWQYVLLVVAPIVIGCAAAAVAFVKARP